MFLSLKDAVNVNETAVECKESENVNGIYVHFNTTYTEENIRKKHYKKH